MTQPIKGEALLPFCAPPPVEPQPSNAEEGTGEFALLLEGEMESEAVGSVSEEPQEKKTTREESADVTPAEPWTWFGFASQVVITTPSPEIVSVPQAVDQLTGDFASEASSSVETPETLALPVPRPGSNAEAVPSPAADQQILPSGVPLKTPVAEQSAVKTPEIVGKSNGMFVAQRPAMLLLDRKVEKEPCSEEKGSGNAFSIETQDFLSESEQIRPVAPIEPEHRFNDKGDDVAQFDASAAEMLFETADLPSEPAAESPALSESKAVATIEQVQQQVQILRSSNLDKLEVVLRPDTDTQLFVQVSKVEGQIQVQIRCERGDVAFLENHWGKIQQSLSTQGIKVEPLQHSFASTDFSHSNSQDQQRHDPSHGADIDRVGVFLPINTTKPSGSAPVVDARGWQRWA